MLRQSKKSHRCTWEDKATQDGEAAHLLTIHPFNAMEGADTHPHSRGILPNRCDY